MVFTLVQHRGGDVNDGILLVSLNMTARLPTIPPSPVIDSSIYFTHGFVTVGHAAFEATLSNTASIATRSYIHE